MIRFAWLPLVLVLVACGGKSPTTPTPAAPSPPVVPACQQHRTAEVTFRNNGDRTIDVLLDGGVVGTLGPQQSGLTRTIAAGVAHNVRFELTNTRLNLCATWNPIPVECSTPTWGSCTY